MKVIGLCGGSGSGKGAVSRIFLEYGIPTVDTDAVYRELTSGDGECMRALIRQFGEKIALSDGSLNRAELRKIVFSGADKDLRREKLNEISHKFILDTTRDILRAYRAEGRELAAIDAPLLFESGFNRECDLTVAVVADSETRIERIARRDGITRAEAQARINTQIPDTQLMEMADFTIINNSSLADLRESVSELLVKIKIQNRKL